MNAGTTAIQTSCTTEQADEVIESIGMTDLVEDYEQNELGHVYSLKDHTVIVVTSVTSFAHLAADEEKGKQ